MACSCKAAMCLLLAFLYNRLDLTHFANKRGQCAFYNFQAFSMAIQCGSMVLQYVRVLLQDIEHTFDILALRAHNRHEYRELLIIFALSAFELCESFVSSQCDESFLNAPFLFKFTGQGIFITQMFLQVVGGDLNIRVSERLTNIGDLCTLIVHRDGERMTWRMKF
jgi:hypothetical protein